MQGLPESSADRDNNSLVIKQPNQLECEKLLTAFISTCKPVALHILNVSQSLERSVRKKLLQVSNLLSELEALISCSTYV